MNALPIDAATELIISVWARDAGMSPEDFIAQCVTRYGRQFRDDELCGKPAAHSEGLEQWATDYREKRNREQDTKRRKDTLNILKRFEMN